MKQRKKQERETRERRKKERKVKQKIVTTNGSIWCPSGPLHPGFSRVAVLRSLKTSHHLHILASMLIGYAIFLFYWLNDSLTSSAN